MKQEKKTTKQKKKEDKKMNKITGILLLILTGYYLIKQVKETVEKNFNEVLKNNNWVDSKES